jgi:hypothetical protein
MAQASDLRALARQRAVLIATARSTSMGTFDRVTVAQSHAIGNATLRLLRQVDGRGVGHVSQDAATNDGRSSRTVAPRIGCDSATLAGPALEATEPNQQPPALRAARRPPSWAQPDDVPMPGSICSCCGFGRWWCEARNPSGWRCWACHPPGHLATEQVVEAKT